MTTAPWQQTFFRSSKVALLAVVVGVANTAAGLAISIVSLTVLARRLRRDAAVRRERRAWIARKDAKRAEWDARWESWGGRVPTARR